jgi:hypothetical protein
VVMTRYGTVRFSVASALVFGCGRIRRCLACWVSMGASASFGRTKNHHCLPSGFRAAIVIASYPIPNEPHDAVAAQLRVAANESRAALGRSQLNAETLC